MSVKTHQQHFSAARSHEESGSPHPGEPRRSDLWWSELVALLALAASLGGLFLGGVYLGDPSTAAMLRGYDLVTALVVVPALAVAAGQTRQGSARARVVAAALIAYLIYTYAYYLFGTGFNDLFLLHAAVLGTGAVALVLQLTGLDAQALAMLLPSRRRARSAAAALGLLAVALGGMWIYYAAHNALTGEIPAGSALVETDTIVHLGLALDLALLVPLYAAAALLLWRRAPWGYALGMIALIAGTLHQLTYVVAMPFQVAADVPGSVSYDAAEPVIIAVYLLGLALLLWPTYHPSSPGRHPEGPTTRIEGRTRFSRTPEEMFDFLADPRNEPSYNPLVVSASKTSPGPIGQGTRFSQHTKTLGRPGHVDIELLEYRRPHELAWHITSSGMDVQGREEISGIEGGSEVRWVWDFKSRGPLLLLGPLVALGGRRLERRVWSDMQRALDGTTTNGAGASGNAPAPGLKPPTTGGATSGEHRKRRGLSATRITVTALGLLAATMGVEHGVGAIVQGTGAPPGLVFRSWPDADVFEALDGEPALTVLPDLLVAGILTVLTSVALGIWTVWGARHARWGLGMVALSTLLLLCGGGFGPPLLGTVAGLLATREGRTWSTPGGHATRVAAQLWPWPLIAAVAGFLMLVPGLQVLYTAWGPVPAELAGLAMLTAFVSTAAAVVVARAHDRVTTAFAQG